MLEIRVFYTRLPTRLSESTYVRLAARLSDDYRDRLARLSDPDARAATLAGLELLETALAESGVCAPPLSVLEYPQAGRPQWRDGPPFSLSHTEGLVICAVGNDPTMAIGIDVERLRPIETTVLRLALPEMALADADSTEVLATWTRAEAVIKAAGASLQRVCEVRFDEDHSSATFDGRSWHLRAVELPWGFAGSIACDRRPFSIRVAVAG